jgi:hypothetical protein
VGMRCDFLLWCDGFWGRPQEHVQCDHTKEPWDRRVGDEKPQALGAWLRDEEITIGEEKDGSGEKNRNCWKGK